jgi:hypothetical protein
MVALLLLLRTRLASEQCSSSAGSAWHSNCC